MECDQILFSTKNSLPRQNSTMEAQQEHEISSKILYAKILLPRCYCVKNVIKTFKSFPTFIWILIVQNIQNIKRFSVYILQEYTAICFVLNLTTKSLLFYQNLKFFCDCDFNDGPLMNESKKWIEWKLLKEWAKKEFFFCEVLCVQITVYLKMF